MLKVDPCNRLQKEKIEKEKAAFEAKIAKWLATFDGILKWEDVRRKYRTQYTTKATAVLGCNTKLTDSIAFACVAQFTAKQLKIFYMKDHSYVSEDDVEGISWGIIFENYLNKEKKIQYFQYFAAYSDKYKVSKGPLLKDERRNR